MEEWTTNELMQRYRSLLATGALAAARHAARQAAIENSDAVVGVAADLQNRLLAHAATTEEIELLTRSGWWNALASVERSAVPFNDAAPIAYPPARVWEELTIRRQKYRAFDLPPPSAAEIRIRRSLAGPVTVDFNETPFEDVIEFVRDYTGLNVVVDRDGLVEADVDPKTPVTLNVRDVSLQSVLNLILRPLDLAAVVRHEVLFITSRTEAAEEMTTRIYPVADLVVPIGNFAALGAGSIGGGGLGPLGPGRGPDEAQTTEELVDLVRRAVAPEIWDVNGGSGSVRAFNRNLVIRAPQGVHEKLGRALDGIRQTERPQVGIGGNAGGIEERVELPGHGNAGDDLPADLARALKDDRHDEAVAALRQRLRSGLGEPWMYEALAISLKVTRAKGRDVRDALLSLVDRHPDRLDLRLSTAEALAGLGQVGPALSLLRETCESFDSVNSLYLLLIFAEQAGDVDDVAWAADRLLAEQWSGQEIDVARTVRRRLEAFAAGLGTRGRRNEAERVRAIVEAPRERDLQIVVHWAGDADVDAYVVEPGNALCSPVTPQTVNGGLLYSDDVDGEERYVAACGFSGEYRLLLRPVWGEPTGGFVTVDVVKHEGSENEIRERHSMRLDDPHPLTIELDDGRRMAREPVGGDDVLLAARFGPQGDRVLPPPVAVVPPAARRGGALLGQIGEGVADGEAGRRDQRLNRVARARRLQAAAASQALGLGLAGGGRGGGAVFFGRQVPFVTGVRPVVTAGAVAFDPIVTVVNEGVSLQAQYVVSPDLRSVRLNLVPVIQTLDSVEAVRTVPIGGTAGGGAAIFGP